MFSGFLARSGEAAARFRSDGSARSGALRHRPLDPRRDHHELQRRLVLRLPRDHLHPPRLSQPRKPFRRDQDEDHHDQVGNDREQHALAPGNRLADRTDVGVIIL